MSWKVSPHTSKSNTLPGMCTIKKIFQWQHVEPSWNTRRVMASNSLLYLSLPSKGFQIAVESCLVFRWRYMNLRTQDVQLHNKTHGVGYLLHYTPAQWEKWFENFCSQSETTYVKYTGPHHTVDKENGLLELGWETAGYSINHSQYYRCYRGGNRHLKPEVGNVLKQRNTPSSRRCGCPADVHTRLIETTTGVSILEGRVPQLSIHEGHDPASITDQVACKTLPEVEDKMVSLVIDVHLNHLNLKLVLQDWVSN